MSSIILQKSKIFLSSLFIAMMWALFIGLKARLKTTNHGKAVYIIKTKFFIFLTYVFEPLHI